MPADPDRETAERIAAELGLQDRLTKRTSPFILDKIIPFLTAARAEGREEAAKERAALEKK